MLSSKREMVDAVRQYAKEHYEEDGWDFVVECYSDDDIAKAIAGNFTIASAIDAMGRTVGILDDRRKDVEAEIF